MSPCLICWAMLGPACCAAATALAGTSGGIGMPFGNISLARVIAACTSGPINSISRSTARW